MMIFGGPFHMFQHVGENYPFFIAYTEKTGCKTMLAETLRLRSFHPLKLIQCSKQLRIRIHGALFIPFFLNFFVFCFLALYGMSMFK